MIISGLWARGMEEERGYPRGPDMIISGPVGKEVGRKGFFNRAGNDHFGPCRRGGREGERGG